MEMYNINIPDTIKEIEYFTYYTTEKNGTLFELARLKNVNPKLLAILNGLDPNDYIFKDQMIMLPQNNYSYYITKDGDTLDTVSKTFNSRLDEVLKNNQTIYLSEGQLLVNKIR